jgi:hypothetical protein
MLEARKVARQNGIELVFEPLRNRMILPPNVSPGRAERLYALADELDARSVNAAKVARVQN